MFARKIVVFALLVSLISLPVSASTYATQEATNVAQETDIVFWQTLPFAALWGYFLDREVFVLLSPGSPVNWTTIGVFAGVVSVANAVVYANKAVKTK